MWEFFLSFDPYTVFIIGALFYALTYLFMNRYLNEKMEELERFERAFLKIRLNPKPTDEEWEALRMQYENVKRGHRIVRILGFMLMGSFSLMSFATVLVIIKR